jgi:hypothetical protein
VKRVLDGESPETFPSNKPQIFELALNLKTIKALARYSSYVFGA